MAPFKKYSILKSEVENIARTDFLNLFSFKNEISSPFGLNLKSGFIQATYTFSNLSAGGQSKSFTKKQSTPRPFKAEQSSEAKISFL